MLYSTVAVEPRMCQAQQERIAIAATAASAYGTDVPSKNDINDTDNRSDSDKTNGFTCPSASGLTLVELLIVISIMAVLAALIAPALGEFVRRSAMQSLGYEFIGAMHTARAEAVNRNTCASICKSSNTSTPTPQCNTMDGDDDEPSNDKPEGYGPNDWQMGWIVFHNPNCTSIGSSDPASPGHIILVRQSGDKRYTLRSVNNKSSFTFGPQGGMSLGETGQLQLMDTLHSQNSLSSAIFVNVMGRTRIETNSNIHSTVKP
jgi:type IV fimbrial biogenesis protein FimT